ncbi:MAG: replicative DNA helicase [Chlorobi bacterium]|nr:replicative DNA helicase [Chlorobiota bacterium]
MESPQQQPSGKRKPGPGRVLDFHPGKVPPHSEDTEKYVLGAMLIDKRGVDATMDLLQPVMFYNPAHQVIHEAMMNLLEEGKTVDLPSLQNKLAQMGKLQEAGGMGYLIELTQNVTSAAHIEYHAREIHEKYLRRELIALGQKMETFGYDETVNIYEAIDEIEQDIYNLSHKGLNESAEPISNIVSRVLTQLDEKAKDEKLPGIPSGYPSLDEITAGWQPGDLIIIAARPSMGKTAFALNLAYNMAILHDVPVAYFSLEMTKEQLIKRLLSRHTLIPSEKFRTGRFSEDEQKKLYRDAKVFNQKNKIYINDQSMLSIFELRAQARRLKQQYGIQAIIIDYLQLMHASDRMKPGNREQEISAISRNLKSLAKELDIPIIALSQLSRKVEDRAAGQTAHKRPMLSDLRESGAIEQDADIVAFIYRPEVYKIDTWDDEEQTPTEGEMELFIAKHRNGRTAQLYFRFEKRYGLIVERDSHADNGGDVFPSRMNTMPPDDDTPPPAGPGPDEDDFPF